MFELIMAGLLLFITVVVLGGVLNPTKPECEEPKEEPKKEEPDTIRPPIKEMVRYYQDKRNRGKFKLLKLQRNPPRSKELLDILHGPDSPTHGTWLLIDRVNNLRVQLKCYEKHERYGAVFHRISFVAVDGLGFKLNEAEEQYLFCGTVGRWVEIQRRHKRWCAFIKDKQERERLMKIYGGGSE